MNGTKTKFKSGLSLLSICLLLNIFVSSNALAASYLCEKTAVAGFHSDGWEPLSYKLDGSEATDTFTLKRPSIDDENKIREMDFFDDVPYQYVGVIQGAGIFYVCPNPPNKNGYMICSAMGGTLEMNLQTGRFLRKNGGGYLHKKPSWGGTTLTIGSCKRL